MTQALLDFEPGSPLEDRFTRFHRRNPHVYRLICRFVNEAIAAGARKLSMKAVFERLRWHVEFETKRSSDFRLNNNYTAFYARLWLREHPERPDFFETRESVKRRTHVA